MGIQERMTRGRIMILLSLLLPLVTSQLLEPTDEFWPGSNQPQNQTDVTQPWVAIEDIITDSPDASATSPTTTTITTTTTTSTTTATTSASTMTTSTTTTTTTTSTMTTFS